MEKVKFLDVWQNIKNAGINKDLELFEKWVLYLNQNYEMDGILKCLTLLSYYVYAFENKELTKDCLIELKNELINHLSEETKEFDLKSKFNDKICNSIKQLGLEQELNEVLEVLESIWLIK